MKISITSEFEALPQKVFNEAIKISSLMSVAAPLIFFRPVKPKNLPEKWEEGSMYAFKLYLLKYIPMGDYKVTIVKIDMRNRTILSDESGHIVKVWQHLITIKPGKNKNTIYNDSILIKAGIKTFFIWLFSNLFYRHRQKKWGRIIRKLY